MSRFLHTMIRVGDLDRSIAFYTGLLGLKELRRRDVPDGKYTLAFLGHAAPPRPPRPAPPSAPHARRSR